MVVDKLRSSMASIKRETHPRIEAAFTCCVQCDEAILVKKDRIAFAWPSSLEPMVRSRLIVEQQIKG